MSEKKSWSAPSNLCFVCIYRAFVFVEPSVTRSPFAELAEEGFTEESVVALSLMGSSRVCEDRAMSCSYPHHGTHPRHVMYSCGSLQGPVLFID